MSHRPWESVPSPLIPAPPPPPRTTTSPPPPPPPPPPYLAASTSAHPTLPPLHSAGLLAPHTKRRRLTPPDVPYSPATSSSSHHSSLRSFPSPTSSPPTLPLPYATAGNPQPYFQRPSYPTASSLAHLVARLCDVVQDLTHALDPPPAPGYPKPPPRQHDSDPADFSTLDAIGHCLEALFIDLRRRADSLGSKQHSHIERQPPASPTLAHLELAHETLKSDNSQLVAALTRAQKRTETLEKKIALVTNENEGMAGEKDRLLGNIELLEETVEEVREERDVAIKDHMEASRQWGIIIENAGKLEDALNKELRDLKKDRGIEDDAGGEGLKERKRVETLERWVREGREKGKEMRQLVERLRELVAEDVG